MIVRETFIGPPFSDQVWTRREWFIRPAAQSASDTTPSFDGTIQRLKSDGDRTTWPTECRIDARPTRSETKTKARVERGVTMSLPSIATPTPRARVGSVDALRGLTILLMVFVNDLGQA